MRVSIKKKHHLRRTLRALGPRTVSLGHTLVHGDYGVRCVASGHMTQNQRESIRRLLARRLRPVSGKYWVYVDNYTPLTKKPRGARMGKGRGKFFAERAPMRAGRLICEFNGLDSKETLKLYRSIASKCPLPVVLVEGPFELARMR